MTPPKRIAITPALHAALTTVGPRLSAANRACAIIGLHASGHDVRGLHDEIGQLLTEPLSAGIKGHLRMLFLSLMLSSEEASAPPLALPAPPSALALDTPFELAALDALPAADPLGDLGDLGLAV